MQFFRSFYHIAYHGSGEWLLQRMTALIMALYSVLLVLLLLIKQPWQFDAWHSMFAHGWLKIATALFLFSLFLHAWQGVQDILVDYIKLLSLRKLLKLVTTLSLLFYAVWTVRILWNI